MLDHETALNLAHGGFRITRFEEFHGETIRIVYERKDKQPAKPQPLRPARKRKRAKR